MNAREESTAAESNGDAGLLGGLPRTRPQRTSARRAASRAATSSQQAKDTPSKPRSRRASSAKSATKASHSVNGSGPAHETAKPRKKATRAATAKAGARTRGKAKAPSREQPPVPPQGYESDSDRARGSVRPPGGADFAATAVEAVTELARAGLSTGERLVRDVLGLRR